MAEEKKLWTERLEHLDRRWIFIVVALAILFPLVKPLGFPVSVTEPVRAFHDAIDRLPPGARVLVSADWDPGSRAELKPVTIALLHQLFSKDVDVILMSLWPAGVRMIEQCLEEVTPDYPQKKYGEDYVNLGFKEGAEVVMVSLGESIPETYPRDSHGTPLEEIPMMQGVRNYDDIDLLIVLSAGYPGTKEWVQQVQDRFKKDMISGCAGVSAPEYYPYYESKQLLGLIGGMKEREE